MEYSRIDAKGHFTDEQPTSLVVGSSAGVDEKPGFAKQVKAILEERGLQGMEPMGQWGVVIPIAEIKKLGANLDAALDEVEAQANARIAVNMSFAKPAPTQEPPPTTIKTTPAFEAPLIAQQNPPASNILAKPDSGKPLQPTALHAKENGSWELSFPDSASTHDIAKFLKENNIAGTMIISKMGARPGEIHLRPNSKEGIEAVKDWGIDHMPSAKCINVEQMLDGAVVASNTTWERSRLSNDQSNYRAIVGSAKEGRNLKDSLVAASSGKLKPDQVQVDDKHPDKVRVRVFGDAIAIAEGIVCKAKEARNYDPIGEAYQGIIVSAKDFKPELDSPQMHKLKSVTGGAQGVQAGTSTMPTAAFAYQSGVEVKTRG